MASPLVINLPVSASAVVGTAGLGAGNLLTDSPKEGWVAGATTAAVVLDLGTAQMIDFIYLGSVNGAAGLTWTATYHATANTGLGNTALATAVAVTPKVPGGLMHLYVRLAAPVLARYIRLALVQGAGGANLTAGIFRAGLSLRPAWGQEWGNGRAIIDTGVRERLRDGGFGIDLGIRKVYFQWTFGDLSDDEVEALQALAMQLGETGPFVLVETVGSGVPVKNEGTHWGVFDKLEAYERRDPDQTRWTFKFEQWL